MRILVSGSSGLIGRALIARLEGDRHTVYRVVRGDPSIGQASIDVGRRHLDLSQLPEGGLDRIDAVINLSGERITPARWTETKRERLRSSRVVVTDLLARAIAAAEEVPAVFVSASAIGFYGDRGDEELDEKSSVGSGFLAELCRSWEDATSPASDRGVRVVLVRTGIVLARKNPLIAAQLPLFRLGLGARLGSGRQWMSWISLEDQVDGIIHAALTPSIDGPCNLVSPEPARNADFTAAFAGAVGRRAHIAIPAALLEVAIGSEAAKELALASQRVRPRRLLETGFAFSHDKLADALSLATK